MSNSWFADTNTNKVQLHTTWFYESSSIAILQKVMNHVSVPKKTVYLLFEPSTFDVNLKKKKSQQKKNQSNSFFF